MRRRLPSTPLLAATLLVLGLASSASANSISMVWISTSGAGIGVGTPTLVNVSVSDTAVLEIRVNVGAGGVTAVGLTFAYNPAVIEATNLQMCPGPTAGNPFGPGNCGNTSGAGGFGSLLTVSSATVLGGGLAGGVQFTTPPSGQTSGSFELAHITFHGAGAGSTGAAFYRPGLDGLVRQSDGGFSLPPASGATITLAVIPEPGTLGLLTLGVAALAWPRATRRRPRGGDRGRPGH